MKNTLELIEKLKSKMQRSLKQANASQGKRLSSEYLDPSKMFSSYQNQETRYLTITRNP